MPVNKDIIIANSTTLLSIAVALILQFCDIALLWKIHEMEALIHEMEAL